MTSSTPQLFTGLGAALAVFLSAAGACCASIPAGMFALRAQGGMLAFVPIMQGGVLAVYGLILGVILARAVENNDMTEAQGYNNFSAGLAVGLSCLASGWGMARFVDSYMKMNNEDGGGPAAADDDAANLAPQHEPLIPINSNRRPPLEPTKKFILVLIFFESIGLYGLIVSLFLSASK